MAVTKTTIVSLLVVLAITFNQGAARPSLSNNELSSSKEDGTRIYTLPTAIKKDLVIVLNGTLDTNDTTFIVELPSIRGNASCQITYNYIKDTNIFITPGVDEYISADYDLTKQVVPGSNEGPSFSLTMVPRVDKNEDPNMFAMTFYTREMDTSSHLICKIVNFDDINQIVIKQGVSRVDSLLFEFQ